MNTRGDFAKIIFGPGSKAPPEHSIGALLVDAGKITPEDAERILRYARDHKQRFGDAAIALKLVSDDDIQQVLAKQFEYPYLQPGESSVSDEVVAAWTPFSKQVEALRALRSQLLLRWFSEAEKSLAIVSPARSDGRSHLAANLAVVFSQMGERTLLIDADLRNPRQQHLFGLSNGIGLSTILAERGTLEAIQRIPSFVDLSVLTSGPVPPNPSELLGRQMFQTVMAECSQRFDVIILDTPPAVTGSDGQIVASKCNGALLLARCDRTRLDDCRDLAESIGASNARIVGTVLNHH